MFEGNQPSAIEQAEALLGAMADAARRADQAMREGLVPYDHRVGFARRNLLQLWFWYADLTRMRPRSTMLTGARRQLRLAIAVYRSLNLRETRGIDTNALRRRTSVRAA
jgi:hypothetical protein